MEERCEKEKRYPLVSAGGDWSIRRYFAKEREEKRERQKNKKGKDRKKRTARKGAYEAVKASKRTDVRRLPYSKSTLTGLAHE